MKIVSWNVNSVRARISNIIEYLKSSKPNLLFLQEIKTEDKNFPNETFKEIGYDSYVFGQKSYNGVAFLSNLKIDNIKNNLFNDQLKQSRIISADINNKSKKIKLINIYVPNGNPVETDKYKYKKDWLNSFIDEIKKILNKNKNIIIGGDFNIIPDKIDVYNEKKFENDALYKIEIRKKFRELINMGFYDIFRHINKETREYTFWDYMAGAWHKNNGMRIDHFLISKNILEDIKIIKINKEPRSQSKPSDHTPIELTLK